MASFLDRIEQMIAPAMEDMGYGLVRLQLQGDRRPTLQIMAERLDRSPMGVEDCADISRAISPILDVEDPFDGTYALEVSSPGIDRPLIKPQDFERFAGFEAKVEMAYLLEGRKRFSGRLLGLVNDHVQIMVDGDTVDLPYGDIVKAKLVLTDDLIAAAAQEQGL